MHKLHQSLRAFSPFLAWAILISTLASCAGGSSPDSATESKVATIVLAEDSRTITKELKGFLDDSDPHIRALASRAVGRIGVDSAPLSVIDSALQRNLHDSVVEVSAMTAFAYGLLPKDSALANDLIEFAFTAPKKAAENAIVSAGRLADSANTQVIQKMMILLNHPQASYRSHTAMALLFCNAKSTFDELSQVALTDKVKSVRDTALYALVRLRASLAVEVYLAFLDDTSSYLQALALRGLMAVNDTTLAPQVIQFLSAEDVNLRSQAIATLGTLQCSQSADALVATVDSEQDKRLSAQALNALVGFTEKRNDKLAEQFLTKQNDLGLQSAAVAYLAGSFNGVLSSLLDSVLRKGNPRLLSAFFEGLNRDIPERQLYSFCEELLHAPQFQATGPAYYSAYALYDELELKRNDWMNGKTLWEIVTSDTDFVMKTAMLEYAGRRKAPWFFDVALPLARIIADGENRIRALEYQDLYRSLLTATASYFSSNIDTLDNAPEQTKLNVREIFNLCLQSRDYIVSKQAADYLHRYFQEDVETKINKPETEYDPHTLAEELATARVQHKSVTIALNNQEITIELDYDAAPMTCLSFLKLAANGSYEELVFHRVIPNFVAQCGDPRGDGWGGPGYSIRCEYSKRPYVRGAVGMATSGKDTGGSQFFITLSAQPHLDARYTVFGAVIAGMNIADAIKQGDRGTVTIAN